MSLPRWYPQQRRNHGGSLQLHCFKASRMHQISGVFQELLVAADVVDMIPERSGIG